MAIKIYYGAMKDHPLASFGPVLTPLSQHLKKHMTEKNKDHESDYLACPALTDAMRNTYVVEAPLDMTFYFDGTTPAVRQSGRGENLIANAPSHQQHNNLDLLSKTSLQFLYNYFLVLAAEKPTMMWVTPPFMHTSKFYGFAGKFDIGQWVRPVSFVVELYEEFTVKEGEALCYLRFESDEKINLIKTQLDAEFLKMTSPFYNLKTFYGRKPLSFLYKKMMQSKKMTAILKNLEENRLE